MKQIVAPTDFSDCALDALKTAADIARKGDAKIVLLHTYDRSYAGMEVDKIKQRTIRVAGHAQMKKLVESKFMEGLDTKTVFKIDKDVWEVVGESPIKNAGLIVMGTHGTKGWKESFIGSNTQRVVQMANCPVLAVKDRKKEFNLKQVIIASDFYEENASTFRGVKTLLDIYKPLIHLLKINTLHGFDTTHFNELRMEKFAKKFKLQDYETHIYDDRSVEEGLLNFMRSIRPDLVCIQTHGRTGLSHMMNSSIAEKLVNHLSVPVLTTKIRGEKIEHQPFYPL